MKNKSLIILSLLLVSIFIIGQTYAQNGYMGRRFNVYFGTRLNPSWLMANHLEEKGFFKFDPWYNAGLEVTLKKNGNVGTEYHFYNTIYPTCYYDGFTSTETPNAYDKINVQGIGIYYKKYLDPYAPIGSFVKYQINYFFYKAEALHMAEGPQPSVNSTMIGVEIGYGKTYIIKNYITLTPNFSTGLTYGKGELNTFMELGEASVTTLADRKVRNMGFINIGLNIGVLPL